VIELTLDAVARDGNAVGRHPESGKIVFVADGIPGERVQVEIVDEHPRWMRGRLHRVLTASPDRVTPPCPYAGPPQPVTLPDGSVLNPAGEVRCGGCVWQHIDYERQLHLKREILLEQFTRLAGLSQKVAEEILLETLALGHPQEEGLLTEGYLLQMSFPLNSQGQASLFSREGNPAHPALLPVDRCLLHHPQLADLFQAFQVDEEEGSLLAADLTAVSMSVGATGDEIREGQEGMLVLHSEEGNAPALEMNLPVNVLLWRPTGKQSASTELIIGDWGYPVRLGEQTLISYPPLGEPPMSLPHFLGNEAVALVTAQLLELQPFHHLIHIGAGAGLVSLALAQQAMTVIAIEEHELAVAALQANIAGADNVDLRRDGPERALKQIRRKSYEADLVVWSPWLHPPTRAVAEQIYRLFIPRLALIMDDGEQMAEFVPRLAEVGYQLTAIQPLDLHPHQELSHLIARFDRKPG
jgi:tRNA/tmRNA/rRNA uracil-C5-methylase (TrmA/RlmC/RlmD family)